MTKAPNAKVKHEFFWQKVIPVILSFLWTAGHIQSMKVWNTNTFYLLNFHILHFDDKGSNCEIEFVWLKDQISFS